MGYATGALPMTIAHIRPHDDPIELRLHRLPEMSDHEFFEFCRANDGLRLERRASGEIIVMAPAGWNSSRCTLEIGAFVSAWAKFDGSGVASESSAGFVLPNGAIRAPDVAWIRRERLDGLSPEELTRFLPRCPDFVVELRSPSDSLADLQEKLDEYIENGARLGWLVDPLERTVHVYRQGQPPECLDAPEIVTGDPELPSLRVDMTRVWEGDA